MEREEENKIEKEPIGQIKHWKISRKDTIVNDLKNSTGAGIASFLLSLLSFLLILISLMTSYLNEGQAGIVIGIFQFVGFFIAVISIFFALRGYKNHEKIRHYMEKRGIILSVIDIVIYLFLFIFGIILLHRM